MSDDRSGITRRDLLLGATVAGATAATPSLIAPAGAATAISADPTVNQTAENLSVSEFALLAVIVERLIPSDANGPGAKEARVVNYIDHALGGALLASRPIYAAGLSALDLYARVSRGKAFLELSASDQDSVLIDCETGGATGFAGSSAQFFALLLNHTRQGMFGDPTYGGNADFVGWDLVGYPGLRLAVLPTDQQALEANRLPVNRKSAYDMGGFHHAASDGEKTHDH